jgi:catalase
VPVRYRFVPQAGEHYLSEAALKSKSPNYLVDEIAPRVAKSPVRFTWFAQVGEPPDRSDDPSVAWPDSRRLVKLGVITIDKPDPNTAASDRKLLFLPGTLPPGIGIADPMVTVRNAAHPVSFHQRQWRLACYRTDGGAAFLSQCCIQLGWPPRGVIGSSAAVDDVHCPQRAP